MVLHGYEAVKEALINHGEEFAGRGTIPVFDKLKKNCGKCPCTNMFMCLHIHASNCAHAPMCSYCVLCCGHREYEDGKQT